MKVLHLSCQINASSILFFCIIAAFSNYRVRSVATENKENERNDQIHLLRQIDRGHHGDNILQSKTRGASRKISTKKYSINVDEIRLDPEKVRSFCNHFPRPAILNVGLLQGTEDKDTINHLLEYSDHPIDTNKTMEMILGGNANGFAKTMAAYDKNFSHDCFALVTNTNIQYTELKDLSYNTIRGSLASINAPPALREYLETELDLKFHHFEHSAGHHHHHSLNSWDIFGIVLGCIFAVILFVLVLIQITCGIGTTLMFRRRPPIMYVRRQLKQEQTQSNT